MQAVPITIKFNFLFKFIAPLIILFLGLTTIAQEVTTYDEAIIYGDKHYANSELLNAKAYYQLALKLKPGDNYANGKISIIVEKMKSTLASEDEFYDIIDLADELYDKNELSAAITLFLKALKIIPNDEYALTKVREIVEFQTNEKEKIASFDKAMAAGRVYITNKQYDNAIASFRKAAGIFPEKDAPITELNNANILKTEYERREVIFNQKLEDAEKYLLIKNYDKALNIYKEADSVFPENNVAKQKIAELIPLNSKQKKYNSQIEKADEFYVSKDFISARRQYLDASKLWPEKNYPADMIEKIDEKLEEGKKDLEKNYKLYVTIGDSLLDIEAYSDALANYNMALNLKPDEAYPQAKINAITLLMAEDAKQKQIDEKYNELMLTAEGLFNQDKLVEAKSSYVDAAELKPYENIPHSQINRIDSLIFVKTKIAEIKQQFDSTIEEGDSFKNQKEYATAIARYDQAIALIPGDKSAQQKKLEVETIQINIQKEAELKKTYEDAVAKGDKLFEDGSFELSRVEFEKAQTLRNDQQYPVKRILDIDNTLIKMAAEQEKRYTESVVAADNFFEQGHYEDAVIKYQLAGSIKPGENYPQQKIAECNGFIAEKLKRLSAEYNVAIADADKLYASKIYDKAIVAYRKAGKIKLDETYPAEMIEKISRYIEENSIVDVIKSSDTISSGITEKFDFEPVKINVRKSNYIFLKAKNLTGNPFKIIFSYGSDTGKNGGFVVQVVEGETTNDYIVRVGNQYKWFAEDNNWFTIIPENGDIEITMLRISKSD
ncbi:MAG: hypothetical protein H8E34_02070 [Bacteroidetes bacterium]|nr:hypothetical protein [Bacteroidota bacterium]MBL6944020.1 hypothetical protein [Bacteroidales bacterium]